MLSGASVRARRYGVFAVILAAAALSAALRPDVLMVVDAPDSSAVSGPGVLLGAGFGAGLTLGDGPLPVLRHGPYVLLNLGLPAWGLLDVGGWGLSASPSFLLGALSAGLVLVLLASSAVAGGAAVVALGTALASPGLLLLALPLLSDRFRSGRGRLVLAAPVFAAASWPWGPLWFQVALGGVSVLLLLLAGRGEAPLRSLPVFALVLAVGSGLVYADEYSGVPTPQPGDLERCFELEDFNISHNVRCAEGVMWFWGLNLPYEGGREELRSVTMGRDFVSQECHFGEEALSEAAAFRDREAVSSGFSSLCNFSLPHGIGSSASFFSEDPVAASLSACESVWFPDVSEGNAHAQCWYGAGQGFARRTSYDLEAVADFCMQAPAAWPAGNCFQGANMSAMLLGSAREETFMPLSAEFCSGVPLDLAYSCYRYLALPRAEYGDVTGAVEETAEACLDLALGMHAEACWEGVGLVNGVISPVGWSEDEIREVVAVNSSFCLLAPLPGYQLECLVYAILAVADERGGVPLSLFVDLMPSAADVDYLYERYYDRDEMHAARSTLLEE